MGMAESSDQRRERGDRTRRVILEAAVEIISEGRNITAREVASRSGFSHGNLFHHFGALDKLEEEAALLMLESLVDQAISGKADSLEGYLQVLGDQTIALLQQHHRSMVSLHRFFLTLAEREHFRVKLAAFERKIEQRIAQELRVLIQPPIPEQDLAHAASLVSMLLDGLGTNMMVFNDVDALRNLWNYAAAALGRAFRQG